MTEATCTAAHCTVPDLIDLAVGPQPELNIRLLNALLHIIVANIDVGGLRVKFNTTTSLAAALATPRHPDDLVKFYDVFGAANDGHLDLKTCQLQLKSAASMQPVIALAVLDQTVTKRGTRAVHKDIVEASIPETREMLSSARSGNEQPLVKMLDLLNLTKRLEAAELAVQKLTSLVCRQLQGSETVEGEGGTAGGSSTESDFMVKYEELFKELAEWRETVDKNFAFSSKKLGTLSMQMESISKKQNSLSSKLEEQELLVVTLTDNVQELQTWMESQTGDSNTREEDYDSNGELIIKEPLPNSMSGIIARLTYIEDHCCNELEVLKGGSGGLPSTDSAKMCHENVAGTDPTLKILSLVEKHEKDIQTLQFEHIVSEHAINLLKQSIETMEKGSEARRQLICKLQNDVLQLVCSIEDLLLFAENTKSTLLDHQERLEELRSDLIGVNVDVNMLVQERKDRKRQYDALIDQLEQIKCVKADREEVEDMVIDKADIVDMRTKVSYAHFEDVTRDLSLSVIGALEKIVETDADWHRAIDTLLQMLEKKLERTEAETLGRSLDDKLIALKDKLRAFAMFRLSCESAATEQKYLRDVKCLACNAQTYMKAEETLSEITRIDRFGRRPDAEAVQFARVTVPCCKRHEINTTATVKRYCGGQHTRTEAEERTSKKGNFIVQTGGVPLGPDVMHSKRGTDGVLYRVDINRCDCEGVCKCK